MRIEQNALLFPTSFGEATVRGVGLSGELREEQLLHSFLSASPGDTHLAALLTALDKQNITSFTPPLTFGNIQGEESREEGGYLALDLPLQQQDADGHKFAYVLLRVYRGIVQFEFPVDPAAPRHSAWALQMVNAAAGPVPRQGFTRFIVPFDVAPATANRLGFATAPLNTPLDQGILHILRVVISDILGPPAKLLAEAAAKFADSQINPNPGMKWFKPKFPAMTPADVRALSGKRTLLFVHGIISSIEDAFSGIYGSPTLYPYLSQKYGPNIIGYDHYTLSETHLDTAADLVGTLPNGAILDIVCHSRGAAVVRGMLEHPDVSPILDAKKIKVNTVIFVAGANGGTPLADMDNWKTLVNAIAYIASLIPAGPAGVIANAIATILKVALELASELDSLTMLAPDSDFYRAIKAVNSSPAQKYLFARADYDLSQKSSVLAFLLGQVMNGANDVVIPWDSAGQFYATPQGGAPTAILEFDPKKRPQTTVYHTDFFVQQGTWDGLAKYLGV